MVDHAIYVYDCKFKIYFFKLVFQIPFFILFINQSSYFCLANETNNTIGIDQTDWVRDKLKKYFDFQWNAFSWVLHRFILFFMQCVLYVSCTLCYQPYYLLSLHSAIQRWCTIQNVDCYTHIIQVNFYRISTQFFFHSFHFSFGTKSQIKGIYNVDFYFSFPSYWVIFLLNFCIATTDVWKKKKKNGEC